MKRITTTILLTLQVCLVLSFQHLGARVAYAEEAGDEGLALEVQELAASPEDLPLVQPEQQLVGFEGVGDAVAPSGEVIVDADGQDGPAQTSMDDNDGDEQPDGQLGQDEEAGQEEEPEAAPTPEEELDAFAAAHKDDLADGTYSIDSQLASNLSIDVSGGSTSNGASIIIWNSKTADNQRWTIEGDGSGYVTIKSVQSGKVLDVRSGSAVPATDVIQWSEKTDGFARNQHWIISLQDDGSYKITSALLAADGRRLVLDVRGGKGVAGSGICIYTEKEGIAANQSWRFDRPWDLVVDELAAAHRDDIADGTYVIESALGSNLVLDVSGASVSQGANVIVWPSKSSANEAWKITHDSNGYVIITNVMSGLVLDVYGGKATSGSAAIQWADKLTGARNQRWIVSLESDGTYKVTSALTGNKLVLDVKGGKAASGAQVIVWKDGGDKKNQRFVFAPASDSFSSTLLIRTGTYAIRADNGEEKVLDVSGGKLNAGSRVGLWKEKSVYNANQVWQLRYGNDGQAHLRIGDKGLELAVVNGEATLSAQPFVWAFEAADGGRFALRDAQSGLYLSIDPVDARLVLTEDAASAQLWKLTSSTVTNDPKKTLNDLRDYVLTYRTNVGVTVCREKSTGKACYGFHRIGNVELHFDEFTGAMQEDGFQLLADTLLESAYMPDVLADMVEQSLEGAKVRIFGDSISAGWGVEDKHVTDGETFATVGGNAYREPSSSVPSWANALHDWLEATGGSLLNASVAGKGFKWFANHVQELVPDDQQFDLTIVMLGTNDRSSSTEALVDHALTLLERTLATSQKVIVVLPSPVLDSKGTRVVSQTLRNLCNENGVPLIDLYRAFYSVADSGEFASGQLFTDSLHPSLVGQAVIWSIIARSLGIA